MVKHFTFLILFIGVMVGSGWAQDTFYSHGDGSFTVVTWNTARDGSGANALANDFTDGDDIFIIESGDEIDQDAVLNIASFTIETNGSFVGSADNLTVNGNLEVQNASTFTATSATTSVSGDVTVNGTFDANGGIFAMQDAAAGVDNAELSGVANFNQLIINRIPDSEAVFLNAGGDQITAVSTAINGGTLRLTRINAASDFGSVSGNTGTHIEVNGANVANWENLGDFSAYMAVPGTEVRYVGTGAATIPPTIDGANYRILSVDDGGDAKTIAAALTVEESLNIYGSNTLNMAANTTVNGNLLISSGSLNATASLNLVGDIQINNSGSFANGGLTHTIGGDWTEVDAGTMTGTGTIRFTTGAHQITTNGGTLDFHNITAEAGATLSFDETETTNITGNMGLTGVCGNEITINSLGASSTLDFSSSQTWNNVVVENIQANTNIPTILNGTATGLTNLSSGADCSTTTRYWRGMNAACNGRWEDGDCWSSTYLGTGGDGQPTASQDAIFDDRSFDASHTVVNVHNNEECRDMIWVGVTNNPTINRTNRDRLDIYGSLKLLPPSEMTWNYTREVRFSGTGNFTITTAGQTIVEDFRFDNTNGSWTIQDEFTSNEDVELEAGTLNTNNQTVTLGRLDLAVADGASNEQRSIDLGTSVINFTNGRLTLDLRGSNLTFSGANATYNFSRNANQDIRLGSTGVELGVINVNMTTNRLLRIYTVDDASQTFTFGDITANNQNNIEVYGSSNKAFASITTTAQNYLRINGTNNTYNGTVHLENPNGEDTDFNGINTFNQAVTINGYTNDTRRVEFYGSTFNSTVTLTNTARARFYDGTVFNGLVTLGPGTATGGNNRVSARFRNNTTFNAGLYADVYAWMEFGDNPGGGDVTNFTGSNTVFFADNVEALFERDVVSGTNVTWDIGPNSDGTGFVNFTGSSSTFGGNVVIRDGARNIDFRNTTIFNALLTIEGTVAASEVIRFHGLNVFNDNVSFTTAPNDRAIEFETGSNAVFGASAPLSISGGSRVIFRNSSTLNSTLNVGNDAHVLFSTNGGSSTFVEDITCLDNVRFEARRQTRITGNLLFGDNADVRFNQVDGTDFEITGTTTFGDNTFQAWFNRDATFGGDVEFGINTGTNPVFNGNERRVRFEGNTSFNGSFTVLGTAANDNAVQFLGTNNFGNDAGIDTVYFNTSVTSWAIDFEGGSNANFAANASVNVDANSRVIFRNNSTIESTLDVADGSHVLFSVEGGSSIFNGDITCGNNNRFESRRQTRITGNLSFGDNADVRFNQVDGTDFEITGTTTFGDNTFQAWFNRDATFGGDVEFGINTGTNPVFNGNERRVRFEGNTIFNGKFTIAGTATEQDALRFQGTNQFNGGLEIVSLAAVNQNIRFYGTNTFSGGAVLFNSSNGATADWAINFETDAGNTTFEASAPLTLGDNTYLDIEGASTFHSTITTGSNCWIIFANNGGTTTLNADAAFGENNNIRFDRSVTANSQNITIGLSTELDFETDATSTLHNITVTQANTLEFEQNRTFNFTGNIQNAGSSPADCAAGHYMRGSNFGNNAPTLDFDNPQTWNGFIVRRIAATGAAVDANYSTDYGGNSGIVFNDYLEAHSRAGRDLYWIGGNGDNTNKGHDFSTRDNGNRNDDWNNPRNWSTISGGAPSSCIPHIRDNVFFDSESFDDGINLNVDVNTNDASARNMTWTAVSNNPTLDIRHDFTLSGSIELSNNTTNSMSIQGNDDIFLVPDVTGAPILKTITSNGTSFGNDDIIFNALGNTLRVVDDFDMGDKFMLQAGTFEIPNGITAAVDEFETYRDRGPNPDVFFSDARALTLGDNAVLQIDGGNGRNNPGFDFRGDGFTLTMPGVNSEISLVNTIDDWFSVYTGNAVGRVLPNIIIDGPDDINFETDFNGGTERLTFRNITRNSAGPPMNFEILGRDAPKTYGAINLGANVNHLGNSNRIQGSTTETNIFTDVVIFGDNSEMDFEGLNEFQANVEFGDDNDISFELEGQYFTNGASLTFLDNASFEADYDLHFTGTDTGGLPGNLTFGIAASAIINNNGGTTEIDGTLTIGANANEVIFRRAGIYNGAVTIGDNAIVQFVQGGDRTSTFNSTVNTGTGSFVRFRETATFNNVLTTGISSRTRFAEDGGHTFFNANANLGNNSNNTFFNNITFDDAGLSPDFTLTYGNNSVNLVSDGNGQYDDIILNSGASVVFNNTGGGHFNNYNDITLTTFNTLELVAWRESTITGTFTASVGCDAWGIVRSSVQGAQANITFSSAQTWDNIVVQDLNVRENVAGLDDLTITSGVNLRNLTDTDDSDGFRTINITERDRLNFYWTGAADNNWSTAGNWLEEDPVAAPGVLNPTSCVPNPIDNVFIREGDLHADWLARGNELSINIANAACFSMTWDLGTTNASLSSSNVENRLMIFNNLTWDDNITNNFYGILEFQSNARYEDEVSGGFQTNEISTDAGIIEFEGGLAFDADEDQDIGNWSLNTGIDINDGTIDAYGANFHIVNGVFDANEQPINVEGDFILEAQGRFLYNNDGSGTNAAGTQTVTFDGNTTDVNINMRDGGNNGNDNPFYNIIIAKDDPDHDVRIVREHFRIENDLTITQGRFWDTNEGNGAIYDIRNVANTNGSGGTITIGANGTLMLGNNNRNDAASEFPLVFSDVDLDAASTVVYRDQGEQFVTAFLADGTTSIPYGNLTLTNGRNSDNFAKQLQGAITVRSNLRIEDSYFFDNGYQVTGNTGGASSFTMTNDSRFYIGVIGTSTVMPNFDTYNFENNSWVRYESDLEQVIKGISGVQGSYANVIIRNENNAAVTDPVVKTLDGEMRVRRRLRIGSDTEFWDDGHQIIVDPADRGNDACEITMYEDSYFRLGNATSATTFPDFENGEIDLRENSTVIYNAGVAQEVRRLSDGNNNRQNRNYWNLWLLNSAAHPTGSVPGDGTSIDPSVLAQKTLDATVPATGQPNTLRFRNEFRIEPFVHLNDAGYQILGNETDDTDIIRLDEHTVLSLGISDDATQFPRHTTVANIDLDSTSHVRYSAGVTQTVRGISTLTGTDPTGNSNYGFLTIVDSSASLVAKTLDGTIGVRENFIIESDNDLIDDGYQIYGLDSEPFVMQSNSVLTLGNNDAGATATEFPLNYADTDIDLDAASHVIYNAAASDQTVRGLQNLSGVLPSGNQNYGILTIRNALDAAPVITKTMSGPIGVRGAFTIENHNDLLDNGHQIAGTNGQAFEIQEDAQLTIGDATATVFPQNYVIGDLNLDANSTVSYNANESGVPQIVQGWDSGIDNDLTNNEVYGIIHFNNGGDKELNGDLRFRTSMLTANGVSTYDMGHQITGTNTATFEMQENSNFHFGDNDSSQTGASLFPENVINDNVTLSSTSTIYYQDDEPQTVRKLASTNADENYAELILSGSTKTIGVSPDATGDYLDELHVRRALQLSNQILELNDQRLVLFGTLDRGGASSTFTGSDDSRLTIRGDGALNSTDPVMAELHFTDPAITNLSNLTLDRTGTVDITLGTNLIIGDAANNGSLTLTNGILVLNSQDLTLNSGTSQFTRTNGTITGDATASMIFNGEGELGDHLVFTSGAETLSSFTTNRSSSGNINLGSPLNLVNTGDALTLTDGTITTTADSLLILETGALIAGASNLADLSEGDGDESGLGASGGSNSSYINGPLRKIFGGATTSTDGFRFPVGKGGALREAGLSEISGPSTFTVEYFPTAPVNGGKDHLVDGSDLTHVSLLEYWDIDGDASARVILHFNSNSDVAADDTEWNNLRVSHYDGAEWESIGAGITLSSAGTDGYIISSAQATSFSPFTLGSTTLLNLLPIQLKNFSAKLKAERKIELTWEAVETNSEGYILKRSIGDTDNFEEIVSYLDNQSLVSKNNAEAVSSYNFLDDYNIQPGEVHYYMLEQVDKDGNVTAFDIQAVNVGAKVVLYQNHPNPASQKTTISFSIEKEARTKLEVFDMSGRYVSTIVNEVLDVGTHQYDYDVSDLQTGVYTVKMTYGDKFLNIKMMVAR